jgi:alpha-1,2-mannosyltransferase
LQIIARSWTDAFAKGDWITRERVDRIAAISAFAGSAMLVLLWVGGTRTLDQFGKPIGSDFAAFWSAGRIADTIDPARAWDQQWLNASIRATHGVEYATAWIYPPVFLFVAAPLGAMPYLPALFAWQLFSFGVLALILRAILKSRHDTLVALASPLTPLVLANGQNSFLTIALLGAGLLLLERRSKLAGALLGGLIYKPPIAVMVGPLLLLTRNWPALLVAAVGGAALVLLSATLWGLESWSAFIGAVDFARLYMEQGAVGFHKSASLFSATRAWGASVPFSYAAQAVGLALALLLIWRCSDASPNTRAAAVCAAAALSTPYLLDYDIAVIGLGAAFLYAEARSETFLRYERSALAFIWVAPWLNRPAAEYVSLPLGSMAILLLGWLAWQRASRRDDLPFAGKV